MFVGEGRVSPLPVLKESAGVGCVTSFVLYSGWVVIVSLMLGSWYTTLGMLVCGFSTSHLIAKSKIYITSNDKNIRMSASLMVCLSEVCVCIFLFAYI